MDESRVGSTAPARGAAGLASRPDFTVGNVRLRPSLRMLEGPAGEARAEPRVMQVLVALADAQGAVLSRDALLQICWDGRIVGDDAINRAVGEARRLASEVGAGFAVETVPRVGFRLAGLAESETAAEALAAAPGPRWTRRAIVGSAVALGVVAVGTAALWRERSASARVATLIERGRALQGSGLPDGDARAERAFREAIALQPDNARAWGWLAVVLDDEAAKRETASHALTLDPREANARAVLALQRRDLDSWAQWEDALLAVLEDDPRCALALNHLTFFYQGMGRCRDSLALNERAIAIEPFNPGPQHRRAIKHWIFGNVGEADKVADQAMRLWPRQPQVWNARMIIYAFTGRGEAGLAFLDDMAARPVTITAPAIASWRAALEAIAAPGPGVVARAVRVMGEAAPLAPGLAANAIMAFSYLGEIDAAYRMAEGLFEARGPAVQRARGDRGGELYADAAWGRTQFLFIPAAAAFRADARFPGLCRRMGHVAYWRKRGIWPDPFVRGAIDPARLT